MGSESAPTHGYQSFHLDALLAAASLEPQLDLTRIAKVLIHARLTATCSTRMCVWFGEPAL
jgi:hypothetical protein